MPARWEGPGERDRLRVRNLLRHARGDLVMAHDLARRLEDDRRAELLQELGVIRRQLEAIEHDLVRPQLRIE